MENASSGPVLFVCHDAGGAENVAAWVGSSPDVQFDFLLEGPAIQVFRRVCSRDPNQTREVLGDLSKYRWILTGISWASDLEKAAIVSAKTQKIRCVSYVDHWIDYRERFTLDGRLLVPDEFWVGDHFAYDLANRTFDGAKVSLIQNAFLTHAAREVREKSASVKRDVTAKTHLLYVCEPTVDGARARKGDPLAYGYTEFQAMEGFLDHLLGEERAQACELRIRLHPSESPEKYSSILERFIGRITLEMSRSPLIDDCAWADEIVGCDSMVMAIGVLAGKKVSCAIPSGGVGPNIPFPEIVRLFP